MPDREKVIRGLATCGGDDPDCHNCPYYGEYGKGFGCETIMQRDALTLLKAQEAKEPLIIHKGVVDEVYDYIAECPKCDMTWAMWHPEKMRYCPGCGQTVKWDEPPKEGDNDRA